MNKLLDAGETPTRKIKSLGLEEAWAAEFVCPPIRVENLYFTEHQAEFSGCWHSRGETIHPKLIAAMIPLHKTEQAFPKSILSAIIYRFPEHLMVLENLYQAPKQEELTHNDEKISLLRPIQKWFN